MDYFPSEEMNEGRFPDKYFFWGICATKRKEWTDEYFKKVNE